MTVSLEEFHTLLSPSRLAAMSGFAIFQYTGLLTEAPDPYSVADLDGDEDVDLDDYAHFSAALDGPAVVAEGLDIDDDLDGDGKVTLLDFALFVRCYTGSEYQLSSSGVPPLMHSVDWAIIGVYAFHRYPGWLCLYSQSQRQCCGVFRSRSEFTVVAGGNVAGGHFLRGRHPFGYRGNCRYQRNRGELGYGGTRLLPGRWPSCFSRDFGAVRAF